MGLRVVPSGIHEPACPSWEDHIARAVRELAEFWNLQLFVNRAIETYDEERMLADFANDPAVRAFYGGGDSAA
jgi:hypothetical protein